jgi:hypothetical protein
MHFDLCRKKASPLGIAEIGFVVPARNRPLNCGASGSPWVPDSYKENAYSRASQRFDIWAGWRRNDR